MHFVLASLYLYRSRSLGRKVNFEHVPEDVLVDDFAGGTVQTAQPFTKLMAYPVRNILGPHREGGFGIVAFEILRR